MKNICRHKRCTHYNNGVGTNKYCRYCGRAHDNTVPLLDKIDKYVPIDKYQIQRLELIKFIGIVICIFIAFGLFWWWMIPWN